MDKDSKDADSLYGRGVAKFKSGDRPGGETDIADALAIKADIARLYARRGIGLLDRPPAPAGVVSSAPSPADLDRDFSACMRKYDYRALDACTRAIESGRYAANRLALLHQARGFIYDRFQHDYRRAVADYERYLAVYPEDAATRDVALPDARRKAASNR